MDQDAVIKATKPAVVDLWNAVKAESRLFIQPDDQSQSVIHEIWRGTWEPTRVTEVRLGITQLFHDTGSDIF